jgi:hypothetical protein
VDPVVIDLEQTISQLTQEVRLQFGECYPWFATRGPNSSRIISTAAIGSAMILIASFSEHNIENFIQEYAFGDPLLNDMLQFVVSRTAESEDLPAALGEWILRPRPMPHESRSMGQLLLTRLGKPCYDIAARLRAYAELAEVMNALAQRANIA